MNYVIVGGTSGIGLEVVKSLSNEGHNVLVLSRNFKNINELNGVRWHQWDSIGTNSLEETVHVFSDGIDGLVYCPGTANLKSFNRITPQEFIDDYNLNVVGAIKAIQYFLPKLKKTSNPSIVLFSTVAVQTGMLFHSLIGASKGAIEGLTRSLAAEFTPKIRVNCVAPSLTQTPLMEKLTSTEEKIESSAKRHPLGRIGQANDISNAVLFLLSDKSSWITGQVFHVDGGISSIKL